MKNILNLIDKGIEKLEKDRAMYETLYGVELRDKEAAMLDAEALRTTVANLRAEIDFYADKLASAEMTIDELRRKG